MSADITNKIAKAVEQAASSVLNKITSIPDTASEPIVIEDDVLDEINNDSFVSKKFVSQANKKEAIIKKEEKPEIMPVVELDTEECLIHPNVSIILLELKNLRSHCYLMNYWVCLRYVHLSHFITNVFDFLKVYITYCNIMYW